MTGDQMHPHDLTVSCAVRAPLLLEPVDAKVETLRRCEERGDVGGLVLRSWPDAVSLDASGPESEVVEQFRRFERWAEEAGASIRPPFRIRRRSSMVSEETRRVLVTPILCLACYDGDALVGVYPHSEGETTRTATDAIAALAAGELPAPLTHSTFASGSGDAAGSVGSGPSGADAGGTGAAGVRWAAERGTALPNAECPECGSALVNVQGILSCRSCRWTDADLDALRSPRAKLVYLSLVDGPKSVDALRSALDLNAGNAYAILRTLTERGLVDRTADGTYRLRRERRNSVLSASNG